MQGHPWNELPTCCGGPTLTEEGAAPLLDRDPVLVSEPSGRLPAQLQGWVLAQVLCLGTVLTGVVSPSTSSGTAEHGALFVFQINSFIHIGP